VFGDRANDIAFGEHSYRGVAFGPDHVLDHERADIAGAHQLGGDADSFIHSNCRNAGSFLAQDVSDLHRNLLQMGRRTCFVMARLVYIMPIVNGNSRSIVVTRG
jgi:hypothetical protein